MVVNLINFNKCFCFLVGSQRFAAHRLVLSAVSDYFRAMFNNDVREAVEKEFAIHNIDSDIFLNLINYIYTGISLILFVDFMKSILN